MKKWSNLTLRELDKWQSFGRSLGLSARPWIQKYGEHWQHHLAKAVKSGKSTYGDLTVPKGLRRTDADLYLRTSSKLSARAVVDKRPGSPTLIEHHYFNLSQLRDEEFRKQFQKGVRRHIDPNVKLIEKHLKRHMKMRGDKYDPDRAAKMLERLKPSKEYRITHPYRIPHTKADARETKKFLNSLVPEKQVRKMESKIQSDVDRKYDLLNAEFNFRDIGAAIGAGRDEDEEYNRLIEFLKSGRPISRAAHLGICKSKKAKDRIIKAYGQKYWDENFASQERRVKYSSDRIVHLNPAPGFIQKFYRRGDLGSIMKRPGSKIKQQFYEKVNLKIKKK